MPYLLIGSKLIQLLDAHLALPCNECFFKTTWCTSSAKAIHKLCWLTAWISQYWLHYPANRNTRFGIIHLSHTFQCECLVVVKWAFPDLFGFIFPFSWSIVRTKLIIFTMVNDDRKQERRRKSMHRSITRY